MKHLLLLSSVLLLPSALIAADEIEVSGRVNGVTLFTRGAEVTRTARTAIPAGEHTLVFRGIPQGVNGESLRASGSGTSAVRIQGVEFRTRARREDVSANTEALKKKREAVARFIATQEQTKARLAREQELLAAVRLDALVPESDTVVRPRTATEMTALLQFVAQNGSRLQDEIRIADEKLAELQKDLAVIDADLRALVPGSNLESVVEVTVVAEGAGEAEVGITYQVPSASWSPAYNLLVRSDKGAPEFAVETYGVIQQSTGEDWDRVKLALSTARPHMGLARPMPSARLLDVFVPPPPAAYARKAARSELLAPMAADEARMDSPEEQALALGSGAPVEFEEVDAAISTGGVVSYALPTSVTIKSDGSSEKVRVRSVTLAGAIMNVAVPAFSTQVYREAALTNGADAPLLPGAVNVFSNGSFVGRQGFGYTPAGKEIKLPIGISDDVSITRKLVEKFEDDSGLVRSIRRLRYVYEIETENHSGAEQQVVLLEPAPVSRNEKIKVEVTKVEPANLPADDKKRLQPDAGIMEWRLAVPAKKKQAVRYEFTVEFEAGLNVTGLEGL